MKYVNSYKCVCRSLSKQTYTIWKFIPRKITQSVAMLVPRSLTDRRVRTCLQSTKRSIFPEKHQISTSYSGSTKYRGNTDLAQVPQEIGTRTHIFSLKMYGNNHNNCL